MSLNDVLCCPADHAPLTAAADALGCPRCRRSFEVRADVPVMLLDAGAGEVRHEGELLVRPDYEPVIQFMLNSLRPDQVILDLGSGNRDIDDARIVRMDVSVTPYVDVVGDAHSLPFQDGSLDMVYTAATFEHLHHPFRASREIHRVLKPGGYVIADCNFVFPFHGYPAVYFNASREGMRSLFADFTELEALVAPWQGPGTGLRAIHAEYLRLFAPRTAQERAFAEALQALGEFPMESFDDAFDDEAAARVAAATTFMGVKQPEGSETTLAPPVMDAWRADPALQERFSRPAALVDMKTRALENLFRWAQDVGREREPAIAAWYEALVPFDKRLVLQAPG